MDITLVYFTALQYSEVNRCDLILSCMVYLYYYHFRLTTPAKSSKEDNIPIVSVIFLPACFPHILFLICCLGFFIVFVTVLAFTAICCHFTIDLDNDFLSMKHYAR